MSSDNIFTRNKAIDHKVSPANLFKDRSAFNRQQNRKHKEKAPEKYNSLLEIEKAETQKEKSRPKLFDQIVGFILGLIGKRKQWEEARYKLKTLQNRINTIENVIKESNKNSYNCVKIKDYNV